MGRDLYADLEKIEERGKRKKKGFLSSLVGGGESGEEAPPVHTTKAFTQPPAQPKEEPKPVQQEEAGPQPLKGRQLKMAQQQLLDYKRGLEREYKAGKLSAKECRNLSRKKEIELGLKQPE